MTTYFNVTDAVGPSSNHGITRTERRLAGALADHTEVEFFLMQSGRAWCADRGGVTSRLLPTGPPQLPNVERFGVDRPPAIGTRGSTIRTARALFTTRRGEAARPIHLETLRLEPGDTLLSTGVDWEHGVLDAALRHVVGDGGSFVGFCYDMIPIDHPEWVFPPDPLRFLDHYRRMTEVASSVLCISECTRTDFLRHFPHYGSERVRVLRLGSDTAVDAEPEHEQFAASLFDGAPYAIYCATLDRRKNHQLLYRAIKELTRRGSDANVAFVGMVGSGVDDLIDMLRNDSSVAGRFAHVTNCDDGHLTALYRRARFAVYPSLYEGWGLGATEALSHGTPCLVASGSSLGEAGMGICRELHPLKTSAWANAIAEYFADPPSVPQIHLPTWEETARALLAEVTS